MTRAWLTYMNLKATLLKKRKTFATNGTAPKGCVILSCPEIQNSIVAMYVRKWGKLWLPWTSCMSQKGTSTYFDTWRKSRYRRTRKHMRRPRSN
mmetsp:Transcript_2939/g.3272  ORF Transcript_2939/g.3272 Transcript_2939/m.3272 type:complete len:94 (+) Transcript_2939:737-1018(+)